MILSNDSIKIKNISKNFKNLSVVSNRGVAQNILIKAGEKNKTVYKIN
ncbi:hypothetical protein [Polaribacter porphyrae]|nr:hypothetical protein [Polaribacter porphyrae]